MTDTPQSGEENLRVGRTDVAAGKLPGWMKAANDKYSNFQQFLNHACMREANEIIQDIYKSQQNSFLNTADESIPFYSFKVNVDLIDGISDIDVSNMYFYYKGKKLNITTSQKEFHDSFQTDNELVYFRQENNYLYFFQEYNIEELVLKNSTNEYAFKEEANLIPHHIWNVFDEEAILHNLKRLPRETNKSLKERVNDKAKNPANSTYEGLKKHIERELGVNCENYRLAKNLELDDKEIKLNALYDEGYIEELTNPDGTPTEKLVSIAESVNNRIDTMWGDTIWDESYWDVAENNTYGYLSYQVDK